MRTLESRFLRTIFAGIAIMIFIGLTSHSQALASTESVLHSFTGSPGDGYGPHDLLKHVNGFLYGTSTSGGSHNQGTVFELRPVGAGWSEPIVWEICTAPQSRAADITWEPFSSCRSMVPHGQRQFCGISVTSVATARV